MNNIDHEEFKRQVDSILNDAMRIGCALGVWMGKNTSLITSRAVSEAFSVMQKTYFEEIINLTNKLSHKL